MARERGVPKNLDKRRFTQAQIGAGAVVPPLPVSLSRQAAAMRKVDPLDATGEPDPMALGSN